MFKLNSDSFDPKMIETLVRRGIPHCGALNIQVRHIAPRKVILALPYDAQFAGDPDLGTLAGGVVTSLIDSAMGMAVFSGLAKLIPIATLDLRIDYLRPARAGLVLVADAACYRLTSQIAFARASAYHDNAMDKPVAMALGSFMLGSSDSPPLPEAKILYEGSQS